VCIAVLMLTLWAGYRRDLAGVILAIAGPLGAVVMADNVLKPLVERRWSTGPLTYPSGSVTVAAAVATAAVLLAYRYVGPRVALLWTPIALGVAAAVAVSVVAIRWHYLTDAIAGAALGVGLVCMLAALVSVLPARRAMPRLGWTVQSRTS
jgi:hypothetical protein